MSHKSLISVNLQPFAAAIYPESATSEPSPIYLNSQQFNVVALPGSTELLSVPSNSEINKTEINNASDELPLPPIWLKRFAWRFRIGLGLFLLISSLLGLIGCSVSVASIRWQQATALVPESVLKQVIGQTSTLSEEAAQQLVQSMQGWKVNGSNGELVVLNFNNPNLCGALGCLYSGVWLRKDQPAAQVFSIYLNPNLPNGQVLFKVSDSSQQNPALPCLEVTQFNKTQQQLVRRTHLCFNGQQYQIVDGVLLGNSNFAPTESSFITPSNSSNSRSSDTVHRKLSGNTQTSLSK